MAGQSKLKLAGTPVDATVGVGSNDAGGCGLADKLEVTIPDVSREQAQTLLEQAHAVCPWSNALRGNVVVELILK